MKTLDCRAARRLLDGYYDDELAVSDQIAVSAHLEWCDKCAETVGELRALSLALRSSMPLRAGVVAELSDEEQVSLQSSVVSRANAEQTMSLAAQVQDMFEDMHLVYAGLGGAAAALVCVAVLLGMMRFATNEQPNSLAAMVRILASPGSNQNPVPPLEPRIQMPRPLDQKFSPDPDAADDSLIMLTAVVTREGTIVNLSLLEPGGGRWSPRVGQPKKIEDLLGTVSRAKFEPATVNGLPVAVNIVWVVEHTTVRATRAAVKKRVASVFLPPFVSA